MRILEVADRPGWAIDRLAKPLSEIYENIEMSYFANSEKRFLDSGYTKLEDAPKFLPEKSGTYDILHFHRLDAAMACFRALAQSPIKVLTIHTDRFEEYDDPRIENFDVIICPTKNKAEYLKKKVYYKAPAIYHVPHGIDLKRYSPDQEKPDDKIIGYVGRIVPWKHWGEAMIAANSAGLKIAGTGYVEDAKSFNPHCLSRDNFEWRIFLEEESMPDFYRRMNYFICLSEPNIEAGPLPVMEAMGCGIPVVSTKVGWAKDYATDRENIIFIENNNTLHKTLKKIYEDKDLLNHVKKNALELIKDFSIEKYAENIMNIYNKEYAKRK